MPAAFAVVGGFVVEFAVVMVKNQMLALKANHIGNALEIFCVFGENKRARIVG